MFQFRMNFAPKKIFCLFVISTLSVSVLSVPSVFAERITLKEGNLPEKLQKREAELLEKCRKLQDYLEKSGILYNDKGVEDYINQIVLKMLPQGLSCSHKPNFEFKVVRDPTINAFALPTGKIYIHTGLLARLENEAQLASILAHETSHVLNRDSFYRAESTHSKVVSFKIMDLVLAPVAAVFTGADIGLLGLGFLHAATITGYGRNQEAKADSDGLKMMKMAGYSPQEAVAFFDILIDESKRYDKGAEIYFLASHPSNKMRKKNIEEELAFAPEDGEEKTNEGYYQGMMDDLKLDDAIMNMKLDRYQHSLERLHSLSDDLKGSPGHHFYLAEVKRSMYENPKKVIYELSDKGRRELNKTSELIRKENYYEEALREYKTAIAMDELYAEAHRGLGLLYKAKGENGQAFEQLKRYLELRPGAKDERFVKRCLIDLKKQMELEVN